ncbi:DUF308 domain-containing protein [Aureimonas leprariae]|uniref:DUF308 domain-containing protein n=1 Tax=Plantimonas leprariae TaxID=2615207 RepID=A0A7V7PSI1_9HYPH|nr:DUF308 domain-containing protein [Aureimonas leprariae]KAB0682051.1 DUF308 domain-containing protein [Aureimonas leprariae]
MTTHTNVQLPARSSAGWLRNYYFARFAFSALWVAAAFLIAEDVPTLAAVMLVGYPSWDALANFVDARRSGGLGRNKPQMLNLVVSVLATLAVAAALGTSMNGVLLVFGIWAGFSGIFQLATAVRRWRSFGAQWVMILSGAQSGLAGVFMVSRAYGPDPAGIVSVAPYAAFGAFYFLVSAIWLTVADLRQGSPRTAG